MLQFFMTCGYPDSVAKTAQQRAQTTNQHSARNMAICRLSMHHGNTESRKNLEKKFIFQLSSLNPHGINERFSFAKSFIYSLPFTNCHGSTNSIAPNFPIQTARNLQSSHSLRRRANARNVSTSRLPYGGITYFINSFDYPNLLISDRDCRLRHLDRCFPHSLHYASDRF